MMGTALTLQSPWRLSENTEVPELHFQKAPWLEVIFLHRFHPLWVIVLVTPLYSW